MEMPRPGFVSVTDYLSLPRDHGVWLIDPLLPSSGSLLIYGPAKRGMKSTLATSLVAALSGELPDWMGFRIGKVGRVCYLQLDTPRSTWALRFARLRELGILKFNHDLVYMADRESIEKYPLDILRPDHMLYLKSIVQMWAPVAVVIDTLRKVHSGDENSSTVMSNVITNLVGACHPAALILISHDRKPHPDVDKDILADNRGSTSVVGEMDGIVRMTGNRMYFMGRNIEEGSIKVQKRDIDPMGIVTLVEPVIDKDEEVLQNILKNPSYTSMHAKAKVLAPLLGISEVAAMGRVRRAAPSKPLNLGAPQLVPKISSML